MDIKQNITMAVTLKKHILKLEAKLIALFFCKF